MSDLVDLAVITFSDNVEESERVDFKAQTHFLLSYSNRTRGTRGARCIWHFTNA